ncbi:CBS domain-containing protein [Roseovarius sp. 2305UL8-3]|uniref:CBS domain-containing protein n=1 Tax=Roseovarius conchicola TaxID=3121636 RepID=UPI0035298B07
MLVQQILQAKDSDGVVTITPGTLVSEAAKILAERRIGGLVVSRDGDSADGILSERDIVRSMAVRGATCLTEKIDEMMTRNPVCCHPEDSSDAVLAQMTDGRFRHMPVVDEGKLVGIVTIGDVVKARLEELSMEKNALEGMIMGF